MTAPPIILQSENQNWRTPPWFLDLVREVAPIALDPCTTDENPTGAEKFYTPRENGLAQIWSVHGLAFANPPYGAHLSGPIDPTRPVIRKGVQTGFGTGWAAKMAAHDGEGLYLVPARVETEWWRTLHRWCDWSVFWSSEQYGARINFIDAETGETRDGGSTFPSSVFYRGPNAHRFLATFSKHGTPMPGDPTLRALLTKAFDAGWRL